LYIIYAHCRSPGIEIFSHCLLTQRFAGVMSCSITFHADIAQS